MRHGIGLRILVTVAACVFGGAAACGSDGGSDDEGQPCTFDTDCPSRHCDDGRCRPPSPFNDAGPSSGDACVDVELKLTHITPTVVLLVDQSGSMSDPFVGTDSRWVVLRKTLMDPTGIVMTLQGSIAFGLSLYTWRRADGIATCPEVTSVAPGLNNYASIDAVYEAANPIEGTPTGNAIRKVVGLDGTGNVIPGGLAADTSPGPKIVILATDGNPDSCESFGGNDAASQTRAVQATQAAYTAGVKTFVVAVGDQISEVNQQEIANAGAGQPVSTGTAPYYRTTNQAQLAQALTTIVLAFRSCKFTLHGAINPGSESSGTVTLNGKPLVYQGPDGWRLNGPGELEVLGAACEIVKSSTKADLVVTFPCGTAVPR